MTKLCVDAIDRVFKPLSALQHPFPPGYTFYSPGGHFTYRVVGACCRLFDREELPWPCCRLDWRGKEPSWRRIGRRFVPDMATQNSPSYCVEVLGQDYSGRQFVVTLYAVKLPPSTREWWHARRGKGEGGGRREEGADVTSPGI